jgi:hypothetical protein
MGFNFIIGHVEICVINFRKIYSLFGLTAAQAVRGANDGTAETFWSTQSAIDPNSESSVRAAKLAL